MFYLTTHSTHFIYGYMASDIWLRTILIVRKETCCRHIGYSYRLTAKVLLYAPSHRQDNTYHGFVTPVVEQWLERELMGRGVGLFGGVLGVFLGGWFVLFLTFKKDCDHELQLSIQYSI